MCRDGFGQFIWSKNDSSYVDVKLKVFKKGETKEFRVLQNLTKGEAYLEHFGQLKSQLVVIAKDFGTKRHLNPVLIPTVSKDLDEKLKLAKRLFKLWRDQTEKYVRLCCSTI